MKIAYVITRADDMGGAQVHVRDLATKLHSAGHEVVVLSGGTGPLSEQLIKRGVPFLVVPALGRSIVPWRDAVAVWQLKAVFRRLRPDLVSTHSSKAGWLGRAAAKMSGTRVLLTAHGWNFAEGLPLAKRWPSIVVERLAAPMADHIITVCEHDRQLALQSRIASPEKITRIYNGMPDDTRRRDHRMALEPVRLLMIGRHMPQKDHSTLFEALAKLRDKAWTIALVGAGPDADKNREIAHELGLADRLQFLGYRADVPDLMALTDINVLISNWEGLPRSIIEAMRAELPTVASDVGGIRELVADNRTGYLAPRGDADAVARHLADLIDDRNKRQAFGAQARRLFEQSFTFDAMFDKTMAVYRRLLAGA